MFCTVPSSATGTCNIDELDSGIDLELMLTLKPPDSELKRHLVTLIVGQVLEDDVVLFDDGDIIQL